MKDFHQEAAHDITSIQGGWWWVGFSTLKLAIILAFMITFLMWVYRMSSNSRALGFSMRFTPAWSVIWFLIPIAHLWKPYQVLRDILQANFNSQTDEIYKKRTINKFNLLWTLEILSALTILMSFGLAILSALSNSANLITPSTLIKLDVVSEVTEFFTFVLGIWLVNQVYKLQMTRERTTELAQSKGMRCSLIIKKIKDEESKKYD